jgi:PAS domain-containing protein/DNA-binding CsgD family transcriptional regulator
MPQLLEHDVTGGLYDAALGQRPWSDVAHDLTRLIGGRSLILMVHEPLFQVTDVVTTLGIPDQALVDYAANYALHDVWIQGMHSKRLIDRPVRGQELIDDRSFENSMFYSEFLRPRVEVYHNLCSLLTLSGGRQSVIGIHRPKRAGAYSAGEADQLGRILRHVRSALHLRQCLADQIAVAQSVLTALDSLTAGVVLLGAKGSIVHANEAAERILRANDGICRAGDTLRAANGVEDHRLEALISGARATTLASEMGDAKALPMAGGRVRISRPSGRRAYAVAVTPSARNLAEFGADHATALVFIIDPMQLPPVDAAALEAQFGLPPAEAKLVLALTSGVALPAYARQAGISYHTARTLLARALARTNTGSQLDLLRLVLASMPGVNLR